MLQRTGALFSLSRLGLIDLAIDLVHFMRPDSLIEIGPTSSLLDIALRSSDPSTQRKAAEFLRDHSDLLLTKEGLNWPDYIALTWPQELDFLARDYALEGLMKAILARPRNEWNRGRLNACVVFLVVAFRTEQDPRLRANVAMFLHNLLKIYREVDVLYLPDENLVIDTLRQQVKDTVVDIDRCSDKALLLTDNLKNWIGD